MVDCSQYKEDDYIVALAQRHFDQAKVQSVKWYEREVVNGRQCAACDKLEPLGKDKTVVDE